MIMISPLFFISIPQKLTHPFINVFSECGAIFRLGITKVAVDWTFEWRVVA
jgi:hypothetical protein